MVAIRNIGLILLLAAALVMANDVRLWAATGMFTPIKLADVWLDIDRGSLERLRAVLTPWLGEFLRDALSTWAAPALAVPGLALVWVGVRR
jgi:hypothetical protein